VREVHGWSSLAHWGHGVSDELLVHRHCLDVQGNDDSVLSQVQLEGVPSPMPLRLHDIEGNPPQEVLKHGSDPDAMALEQFKAGCMHSIPYPLQELRLHEWASSVCGPVGKEM
jgi:hypothetical protein